MSSMLPQMITKCELPEVARSNPVRGGWTFRSFAEGKRLPGTGWCGTLAGTSAHSRGCWAPSSDLGSSHFVNTGADIEEIQAPGWPRCPPQC